MVSNSSVKPLDGLEHEKAVAVDPADRLFGSSVLPLSARCAPRLYFYALIIALFNAVLWVFLCQFLAITGQNPGGISL